MILQLLEGMTYIPQSGNQITSQQIQPHLVSIELTEVEDIVHQGEQALGITVYQ